MRKISIITLAAGSLLLLGVGSGTALAAPAVSDQDTTFATGNAQVDLAEITIGGIALQRATSTQAKDLATQTISDHQTALAKLKDVASKVGITLPSEPNAEQQAAAATLKSVATDQFDLTYAQIQVKGHTESIAATQAELSGGSDADVLAFATGYLPVAQMHLTMADSLLTALGGSAPGSVPAGTGGQAATTSTATVVEQSALIGLGALILFLAIVGLRRRQRVTS